jgi:hypothetical protein
MRGMGMQIIQEKWAKSGFPHRTDIFYSAQRGEHAAEAACGYLGRIFLSLPLDLCLLRLQELNKVNLTGNICLFSIGISCYISYTTFSIDLNPCYAGFCSKKFYTLPIIGFSISLGKCRCLSLSDIPVTEHGETETTNSYHFALGRWSFPTCNADTDTNHAAQRHFRHDKWNLIVSVLCSYVELLSRLYQVFCKATIENQLQRCTTVYFKHLETCAT